MIISPCFSCVWDLEVGKREVDFNAHAGDVVSISLAPGIFYFKSKVNQEGSTNLKQRDTVGIVTDVSC